MDNLSQNDLAQIFQQHQNNADIETSEFYKDIDLSIYDKFILFFSGGKDSTYCVLYLLEQGISPDRIELHHHLIDAENNVELMDYPCTEDYCQKFADALGIKLYFSYREGGFHRELMRENQKTGAICYQDEDHTWHKTGGTGGSINTRRKFPQVSADLRVRYCSPYLKIDVGARLITRQDRFLKGKYCVVTGERSSESAKRASYAPYEPHRTDRRNGKRVQRWVDHYRPALYVDEYEVWSMLQRHGVTPHPAYYLGFGRCSCYLCVFSSFNQWSTIRKISPERFETISQLETEFGINIHRKYSVIEQADKGTPNKIEPEYIRQALSYEYEQPILVDPDDWVMPAGAFHGDKSGPS